MCKRGIKREKGKKIEEMWIRTISGKKRKVEIGVQREAKEKVISAKEKYQ